MAKLFGFQCLQYAILDTVDPAVEGQVGAIFPGVLDNGRVANVAYLFDNIQFAQAVQLFLWVNTLQVIAMEAADIKTLVGARVRNLREKRGWSQEQLGFRADLHRNYIGGIERGERNVGLVNLGKLAKALGVRPCQLLP